MLAGRTLSVSEPADRLGSSLAAPRDAAGHAYE
jgi:hypothetical protein